MLRGCRTAGPVPRGRDAHVEEEEEPKKGLFAQAREADLDMKAIGEQLLQRKAQLLEEIKSTGLPEPETTTLEKVEI